MTERALIIYQSNERQFIEQWNAKARRNLSRIAILGEGKNK